MDCIQWQMAEFKMAAFIKMSQNEWVKFFFCKMCESNMAEFKMAAIIKVNENEWLWVRLNYFELEFCAKWLNAFLADLKMAEFNMAAIIKMSQNK